MIWVYILCLAGAAAFYAVLLGFTYPVRGLQVGSGASAECSDIFSLQDWKAVPETLGVFADSCDAIENESGTDLCQVRYKGDSLVDMWEGFGSCQDLKGFSSEGPESYAASLRFEYQGRLGMEGGGAAVWRCNLNGRTYEVVGHSLRELLTKELDLVLRTEGRESIQVLGRPDVFLRLLDDVWVRSYTIEIEYVHADEWWYGGYAGMCEEIELGSDILLLRYGATES